MGVAPPWSSPESSLLDPQGLPGGRESIRRRTIPDTPRIEQTSPEPFGTHAPDPSPRRFRAARDANSCNQNPVDSPSFQNSGVPASGGRTHPALIVSLTRTLNAVRIVPV